MAKKSTPLEKPQAVGRRIRSARESVGLDQGKLAQLLGVTQPTIHKLESGAIEPSPGALVVISRECHVGIDYLLAGHEPPTHGDQDAEGVLQLRRKDDPQSAETRELLDLARKVLEADDDLAKKALTESIKALSRPVKDDNPIKKRARRRSA